MSSVVISGDTSGAITLSAPTVASTTTLTLPTQPGITSTMLLQGMQVYVLNSAFAGSNVSTAQSIFGVGVTLASSTVYAFEMVVALNKTTGATSHSLGLGFGGTATLNNILWEFIGYDSTSATTSVNSSQDSGYVTSAGNSTVSRANASAALNNWKVVRGTVSVNAGGTFIPQYTLSAAPGGAYSTVAGSYIKIVPLAASGSNVSIGTWS